MRWGFLFAVLFSGLPGTATAQYPFEITSIRRMSSQDLIGVKQAWRKDLPERLAVSLRISEDTPGTAVSISASFYDKDDKLIVSYPKPNEIWTNTHHGFEAVRFPETFMKGKTATVYFAISEEVTTKDWKSVLIIFSSGRQTAKRTLPEDALSRIKGPESPAEKANRMDAL
ncbi:MAG: hypothetical protein WCD79_21625 [Chthoniobacteraceae bacterium]